MTPRFISISLGPNDDGRRVDRVARKAFPHLPLSRVYAAIRSGEIRVNGRRVKGDVRVASGDTLEVKAHLVGGRTPAGTGSSGDPGITRGAGIMDGSPGALTHTTGDGRADTRGSSQTRLGDRIIYQSDDLLVINKLRGELVHGRHSLATQVTAYLAGTVAPGVSFAPGPLHRLDRNTSGIVVYSASLRGARDMSRAFHERNVIKVYGAVLSGVVAEPRRWETRLHRDSRRRVTQVLDETSEGGHATGAAADAGPRDHDTRAARPESSGSGIARDALSLVMPIAHRHHASLVGVRIETGRTHQIRAQAAADHCPLLGDRKYGGPPLAGGYILHAGALSLAQRPDGLEMPPLWSPLPPDAEARVRDLFGDAALDALYRLFSSCGTDG